MTTRGLPLEERFFLHVDKNGSDGCWNWTAYRNKKGYGVIRVNGRTLLAHRVSLEIHSINIPSGKVLDHVCHNPACVNPSHLRICGFSENAINRIPPRNTTCGMRGVSRQKKKWQAQIMVKRKLIYLGVFDSPEEAHAAYCKAARDLHGEFAYLGKAV